MTETKTKKKPGRKAGYKITRTNKNKEPFATVERSKFVAEIVKNGGNATAAVKTIRPGYYTPSSAKWQGANMLKDPTTQQMIADACEQAQVTLPAIAARIRAAMDATTWVTTEGKTEVPDHQMRLKSTELAGRFLDAFPKEEKVRGEGSKHLHLHLQQPREVQKFLIEYGRYPTDEERKELEGRDG